MTSRDWLLFLAAATVALATRHEDCLTSTILDGRTSPEYELPSRDVAKLLLQNVNGAQGTSRIYHGDTCVLHVLHNGKQPWDKGCRAYSTSEETVTLELERVADGEVVIRTKADERFYVRRESGTAGLTVKPFGLTVNAVYNCPEGCLQVQGSMVPLHLQGDLVLTLFLRPVSHQERIIFEVKKRELEWETLVFELAKSEDDETHDINDWLSINISALPRYGSWDFVATPLWSAGGRKQFSVPSPDTVVDFRLSRNVIWSVGCTPDLGAGNTSAADSRLLALLLLPVGALAITAFGIAVCVCRRRKADAEAYTHPTIYERIRETAASSTQQLGTLGDHTYETVREPSGLEAPQSQDSARPALPSLPSRPPPKFIVDTVNEFYVSSDIRARLQGDRGED
ncbi:uncharacterized protein [Penaeus vannamei]|uniref:uncharacterized protein n=1 Tax=Penaeus vannamei TaxID=6689 RepID=UPI00387F4324